MNRYWAQDHVTAADLWQEREHGSLVFGGIRPANSCCALLVWAKLKEIADKIGQTIYKLKHSLLAGYMSKALAKPAI